MREKHKILLSLLTFIFSCHISFAQENPVIEGVILSQQGNPLEGVTVNIVNNTDNKSHMTITNKEGIFTYRNVRVGDSFNLFFEYVGYAKDSLINFRINTPGKNTVLVRLDEMSTSMDDIVVVGYGTQKKSDLTGAVASVNTSKLNVQSNSNIGQALQGKIAGVEIVSQGGRPGTGTRIMVRGIGTMNNSAPLYIVDGMYMSNIDGINPNDIKSIDVLKDASAAAIYGSRAANGVVIVSTKSGFNTDGKPLVEFSLNMGLQTPEKYLKMLNASQWAKITTQARASVNLPPLSMATNTESRPDNDWQTLLIKSALMQNYNASIRGGNKYFTYSTGLGYLKQNGMVKNTDFDRYNAQFKAEYKRGVFTFGSNLLLSAQTSKPLDAWGRTNLLGVILQTAPTLSIYDNTNPFGGYGKIVGDMVDLPNPMGFLDNTLFDYTNKSNTLFTNLYGEIKLPYGFKYRLNYSPDFEWQRNFMYKNLFDFGLAKVTSREAVDEQYFKNNMLVENLLTFDRSFGKNKVTGLLGYSLQKFSNRYINASGRGLPPVIKEVGAATEYRTNDTWLQQSAMTSLISRIFYSYDNRYMVTATLRRDGSSKFAKPYRYGNFPSLSLGWNLKEESFMKNFNCIDQLKIRASYGILGNQEIDNYLYQSLVTNNINYPDGNGGLLIGGFPKDFASPSIKWEETGMTNIGLDILVLRQRLNITLDIFNKKTKDILLPVPIPYSTGASNNPVRNAGMVNNKGFEFTISWNDTHTSDFNYGITLTGSAVKNRVVKMGTENGVIDGGTVRGLATTTRTVTGYPIGGFWLIKTDGIFQSEEEVNAYKAADGTLIQPSAKPGDIRFVDANNDGKISSADKQFLGSPFPTFTTGLNFNARYKAFDALIGIQGVFGNKIYNATRLELEGVDKGINYLATVLNHWTPENRTSKFPRLAYDDPNGNNRADSDRFLEDGSFIRLRNIQIGYTLPEASFRNTISKARLSLSIENLLTFTKYTGYTPDINAGNSTWRGFDLFGYPSARIFMLSLQVNF